MRAVLGNLAGGRDVSEGGSDCRESRCSERVEYQGDLEERQRKRAGVQCILTLQRTVNLYHKHMLISQP